MLNLSSWNFLYIVTVVLVAAQPEAPPWGDSYGLYSHLDPSMAIIVIVLVCAFFFVGFISIYIHHCNEYNGIATAAPLAAASSVESSGPKGLDTAVIESFPVFIYSYVKDFKIGKGALECAVCLSEFEDDETLRLMPKCNHVFHPDCIDAWLAYHVTCPVCRTKLTPDSDAKQEDSSPNITELNSNNNNESSPPTAQQVEERNEFVIQVNEGTRPRGKVKGKFLRSHSTGHSLIQPGENVERFTLRLPEEIRKQIAKSGKLKRTRSYDVVSRMEASSTKGEGSSRGKSYTDRWVFLRTPPSVTKTGSVKFQRGGAGGGDGSNSWKLNCLNLRVEQVGKEESSAQPPPV
ncbi:E3 ubiquitin-protein ligase ATL6-like [Durio zibethinus]|uniref:RING-type E3 ubiquitin transferase n=1 Tax=Durio zibethinus TaxID=66656 RepID=A0A6P5ZHM7_DURZI|nr:E3 ubiquitin-protein ligase ATL6-like [Durio zibethinus]